MFGKKRKNRGSKIRRNSYQRKKFSRSKLHFKKLYKKGVNLMADEKLDDAIEIFEQALRIEPDKIEVLMKLGMPDFI